MTTRVHVLSSPAEVAVESARAVAGMLSSSVAERKRCRLMLAGGSTPRATYERLAEPSMSASIDWERVDVFFGDERMVPPDDSASNYRMAREALLDRVNIPSANVHRIAGEAGADEAARRYVLELGTEPLDLVLLGMGDDGHVASLFPGSRALENPDSPVVPSRAPVPPHSRVTLTLPILNSASKVFMIVTGPSKARPLRAVLDQRRSGRPRLPAALVDPEGDRMEWFVDAAAAVLLREAPVQ